MVNNLHADRLGPVTAAVAGYAAITLVTLGALAIMSSATPALATPEAWGHALIVAVFAVALLLRLRVARAGSARALRAVGIIAVVVCAVNIVEAAVPGLFPAWMRVEMLAIALLMLVLALLVHRIRRLRRAELPVPG